MFKKILSISFALLLLTNSIFITNTNIKADKDISANSHNFQAIKAQKEETIYAKLLGDGTVDGIYVVNAYELASDGIITDYGKYDLIKNLTNNYEIKYSDNKTEFAADAGPAYYQGNLISKNLPWDFSIYYTLDNDHILASNLAGKEGALKIKFSTSKNNKVNPIFYENFVLQVSVTFNTASTNNIVAKGATIANTGSNKIVNYTFLPNSNNNFEITADIVDFEMDAISIAAIPFSMDFNTPDTNEIFDDINKLTEAIEEFDKGVNEFNDGVDELKTGANSLAEGSTEIEEGMNELAENSTLIIDGSKEIDKALTTIVYELNKSSSSLNDLNDIPKKLEELSSGLKEITNALTELNKGFKTANNALSKAINNIPKVISEEKLAALAAKNYGDPDFDLLLDHYKSSLTIKETYKQVGPAFDNIKTGISQVSTSMKDLSKSISSSSESETDTAGLLTLIEGMSVLSTNYNDFHVGLKEYLKGVRTLNKSYSKFNNGVDDLSTGLNKLHDGSNELARGSNALYYKTSNMPEEVNNIINDLLASYDTKDYKPVSFVSENNKNVDSVQFIITSDLIKKEPDIIPDVSPPNLTFWDRLKALFNF